MQACTLSHVVVGAWRCLQCVSAVLLCGGKGVGWAQFQVVGRDSPVCRSDVLDALLSSDVMPGAGT